MVTPAHNIATPTTRIPDNTIATTIAPVVDTILAYTGLHLEFTTLIIVRFKGVTDDRIPHTVESSTPGEVSGTNATDTPPPVPDGPTDVPVAAPDDAVRAPITAIVIV